MRKAGTGIKRASKSHSDLLSAPSTLKTDHHPTDCLGRSSEVEGSARILMQARHYRTCMTSVRTQVNRDCPQDLRDPCNQRELGVLVRILRHMVREDDITIIIVLDVRHRFGLQLLTKVLKESVATRDLAHGRVEAWRYGLPQRKHQLVIRVRLDAASSCEDDAAEVSNSIPPAKVL